MADISGKKVMVVESIHAAGIAVLREAGCVVVTPPDPSPEALAPQLGDISGMIVRVSKVPGWMIKSGPNLKVIARHGVGYDTVDVAAATEHGVVVTNTPGANSEAVAELAIGLMICCARSTALLDRGLRSDTLVPPGSKETIGRVLEKRGLVGIELCGKTLGLVGVGAIGTQVARICKTGFRMNVLAYDPYVTTEKAAEMGVTKVDELGTLLEQSDFVSLHLPFSASTKGIIGRPELERMKNTAYLINTARGGLVDEQVLADALKEGVIAGAGIDVYMKEPPSVDNPLMSVENVTLSAHAGGLTQEATANMARDAAQAVVAVLRGERPRAVVNPEVYNR